MSGDDKAGPPRDQGRADGTKRAAAANPAKPAESPLPKAYRRDLEAAQKVDEQTDRSLKRMEELARKYAPGAGKTAKSADDE